MKLRSRLFSYIYQVATIGGLALTLVFWQNCSEVDFSDAQANLTKKSENEPGGSREGDERLPDREDIIDEDGNEVHLPDIPSAPGGDLDKEDSDFLAANCSQRVSGNLSPIQISASAQDKTINGNRGPLTINEASSLTVNESKGPLRILKADSIPLLTVVRGPLSFEANSVDELTNIRGPVSGLALEMGVAKDMRGPLLLEVNNLAELSDHRGPVCLAALNVGPIFNLRGPLKIMGSVGSGQKASVASITETRGPLQIVDADVESIDNHFGPIILVNSSVKSINGARGPIILVDGSDVQNISDHAGPLVNR